MSDDDRIARPAENTAEPPIQAEPFLLAPNRREFDVEYPAWSSPSPFATNSPHADKSQSPRFRLPRWKPLFRGFERPTFSHITILSVLCFIAYPAFYTLTLVAKDQSLFIVRLIVSVWCSGVGFALGCILLRIGAQHLEAATWATVIHMSHEGGGMKLRDLARGSNNPTSFVPAFHIFRSRLGNQETSRHSRKLYDKRPWSLFLAYFTVLVILGPLLPFLFGRIVEIETFVHNQRKVYHEVLITGDLSKEDVDRMNARRGTDWAKHSDSFFPYSGRAAFTIELVDGNDTIYFAQPSSSQFLPGGSGPGTFIESVPIDPKDTPNNTLALADKNALKKNTGVVLRYPQWGIRIRCGKLPNPRVNLIPLSSHNFTHTFVPRDFLQGLFGMFSMELPLEFNLTTPGYDHLEEGIPPNIDLSTISYITESPDSGDGVTLSHSYIYDRSRHGYQGWTTIETVLIRFDTDYTPSGNFPVYFDRSIGSGQWAYTTTMGYDAAVCVKRYESWIIETYNATTGFPSALRVVGKGNDSVPLLPSGNIRGAPITDTRYLNVKGKVEVFGLAFENSINQMVKDTSGGADYSPTPIAISFTEGVGPEGYTKLSPDRLAAILARVSAANTLPYLVGSGPVVAQSYADAVLAYATYKQWGLIGILIFIWILGVIGELCVPTLPFNIPRRKFGVYSWLALFQSQELRFEAADDLDKFVSLDQLEERFLEKRVKFNV